MLQVPTRATLVPDREQSVNFGEAQHVFIEGENLEVLKILYRSYFGRVKMIYIDPPYNKDADVIYQDNFADPLDHYLRSTLDLNMLRPDEKRKVLCGRGHFRAALKVDYKLVTSASQLPSGGV